MHLYTGIYAPTVTPFTSQGQLALDAIPPYVEQLLDDGIDGLFVCGSTGEGMSLTESERMEVAAAFTRAVSGRVPVIVQVGHTSVEAARQLAAHAQEIGADAVAASPPSYFRIDSVDCLVATMAHIAGGAPRLPFFYYHIPSLTHVSLSMPEFLRQAEGAIPNLLGTKFTNPALDEFSRCLDWRDGAGTHFWGADEMFLPAWSVGASAAIGTSYNVAAPLYREIAQCFARNDLPGARAAQRRGIALIELLVRYPFLAALKVILNRRGLELGGCRLPNQNLTKDMQDRFVEEYDAWEANA